MNILLIGTGAFGLAFLGAVLYYLKQILKFLGGQVFSSIEKKEEEMMGALKKILQRDEQFNVWQKELHRLMMNEFANFGQERVFALLYTCPIKNHEQLVIATAGTLEQAHAIGDELIRQQGENLSLWSVRLNTSIAIPRISREEKASVFEKVEKQAFPERPVEVYIQTLRLAAERFASGKVERRAIEKVIKEIETQYGSNSGKK